MISFALSTLQDANRLRQLEWDPGAKIDLSYRGNELAGETGEACNVIKKLERERLGIKGSRSTRDALGNELADVIICCSLVAISQDIDLSSYVFAKFNEKSKDIGLKTRLKVDTQTGIVFVGHEP